MIRDQAPASTRSHRAVRPLAVHLPPDRPTSILAFGSGSRPTGSAAIFRSLVTDLVALGVAAGPTMSPRKPKICRPAFTLEARGDILPDPRYGAAPKLSALSAQTSGDDRIVGIRVR